MFFVSVATLRVDYLNSPPIAVHDYRLLVEGLWNYLGKGLGHPEDLPMLASLIPDDNGVNRTSVEAMTESRSNHELDFADAAEQQPLAALRRFVKAIVWCRKKNSDLYDNVDVPRLEQLLNQIENRTSNDDHALLECLRVVERDCETFAVDVETEQRLTHSGYSSANHADGKGKVSGQTVADQGAKTQQESNSKVSPCRSTSVSRNAKGTQTTKLEAYLTLHHQYENGRVGNYTPAESVDIARESKVKANTVSDFLKKEFNGTGTPRNGYLQACKNEAALLHWLMVKHGDRLPTRTDSLEDYDSADIREKW